MHIEMKQSHRQSNLMENFWQQSRTYHWAEGARAPGGKNSGGGWKAAKRRTVLARPSLAPYGSEVEPGMPGGCVHGDGASNCP